MESETWWEMAGSELEWVKFHSLWNINFVRISKTKLFDLSCREASDFKVAYALAACKQVESKHMFCFWCST